VSFGRVLGGIREFRAEYMGELWLEVFLVAGINDRRDCVERLAALAATIRPDRIQLNTAVRPPAERFVRPVGQRVMESLAALFTPVAEVLPEAPERAGREGDAPPSRAAADRSRDPDAAILGIMARHPCTAADVAQGLGLDVREAHQRIESLVRRGRVRRRKVGGRTCYRAVGKSADDRDDEAIPNRVGD
jgi:wyosine [tRNA(Phe)-imidazoG37] synthetase (radical SAM superfamily)